MRILVTIVVVGLSVGAHAAQLTGKEGLSCSMKTPPKENEPIRDGNRCYREVMAVQRVEAYGHGKESIRWPVYGVKRKYVKCPMLVKS